ncbi:hypothetical protein K6U54_07500 [Vibrio alginolyticus]|uniref:hypothetical protein n=1 Tax=Vibrio alginolyticus TaxID=663 RepID=UPI001EEB2BBF|nr:hypothetical protein [Vibrio alginolyticus]MCG6322170.1 hypothetical protein [Vibrio alginolyticus]
MALNSKNNRKRPISLFNSWHARLLLNKLVAKISKTKIILDYIAKLLSSSVLLGIITLIQLAAGAVLGANISLAFPSKHYDALNANELASTVWSGLHPFTLYTVLAAIVITLLRALVDSYVSTKREKQAIRLAEEQRSLPDSLWLRTYHERYIPTIMNINNSVKQSFDSCSFDDEEIKKHILQLLNIARDMALTWDSKNKEGYAANLMLYAPSSLRIAQFIETHWKQNEMFFDSNSPSSVQEQISGILYVAASVNSESKFYGRKESKDNPRLILPVCLDEDLAKNEYLSKQKLPGAPEAFRLGSHYYTENLLDEIEKWLNEECWHHFSESQAQKIYDRYRTDHSGRSLISIPLKVPTFLQHADSGLEFSQGCIVAVLNVYSNNTRMLRGNANDFNEFCRPLVSTLALCIAAYEIWTNLPATPEEMKKAEAGVQESSEDSEDSEK